MSATVAELREEADDLVRHWGLRQRAATLRRCADAWEAATAAESGIEQAMEVIEHHAGTDGEHHVRWVLDQVVRALLGDGYDEWLAARNAETDEDGEQYGAWDPGVAP